ncbi:MAG: hypothetical protein ACT4P4_25535 [Betaproteobacteria bacterium]
MENVVAPLAGNVVRLAEYRMRRRTARRQPSSTLTAPETRTGNAGNSSAPGPQYFCTRCDADQFRLFASGKAHCAHCGAMMRNLAVKGEA